MKFTVVIPLYNKERHIIRAIKSVLDQSFKNFEIIVVDDGSTDNSVEEAKKICDDRIRIVRQKNGGVSSARNKGIEKAKSDYIGFLDADDVWKHNFLESISALIEKNPNAGAYCTAYDIIKEDKTVVSCSNFYEFEHEWQGIIDDYFKYALNAPLISASSVVIPKSTFKSIGGFPLGIKRGEDLDMWIRIALNYDIVYLNKVCASYYQDSDNRACKKSEVLKNRVSSYSEEILLKAKKHGNNSIYFEEYMIKLIISKARTMIEENDRSRARKILFRYRYTKYNKKQLLKIFILSYMPKKILSVYWS